jgi:hypothetical protein
VNIRTPRGLLQIPWVTALRAGVMRAIDYVRVYGTTGADVSIAAGSGYVTVQTTSAMLAANNTARLVSFSVKHNQALASLMVRAGSAAFLVARLNDGTQTIQSLATGLYTTAAAPVLTGTLATGVGWQATLNANGTVTFDLAKDAAVARSAKCRYFFGDLDTQVAP